MPDASEPTMWKSVGSPQRAWVFVTSTGTPRAAHTLLKLTPEAMTATSASCGPSSGASLRAERRAQVLDREGTRRLTGGRVAVERGVEHAGAGGPDRQERADAEDPHRDADRQRDRAHREGHG